MYKLFGDNVVSVNACWSVYPGCSLNDITVDKILRKRSRTSENNEYDVKKEYIYCTQAAYKIWGGKKVKFTHKWSDTFEQHVRWMQVSTAALLILTLRSEPFCLQKPTKSTERVLSSFFYRNVFAWNIKTLDSLQNAIKMVDLKDSLHGSMYKIHN